VSTVSLPVTELRLRVVAEHPARDLDAARAAAHAFLTALGIDMNQEALAETPTRMARAYAESLTPREFDLTTFDNNEGYEQLVLVQGIPFRSLCEHHALPFIGTADVGYLPGKRIIGLSKLARLVELFVHRAGAGADDQAGRRLARRTPGSQGGGSGAARRAPVHDVAWSAGLGRHDGDLGAHGLLLDDARARQEFVTLTHPTR
jgi:GTP cyclohydrolase IA